MVRCFLTTFDNPYSPYEEFEKWYQYDIEHGYNSSGLLMRIAETSSQFTDNENAYEIEKAIDKIVAADPINIYKKLKVISLMCIKFLQEGKTGSSRSVSSAECRDFRKQVKVIVTYLIPVTAQLQFQPHSVLPEGVTLPVTITM